MGYGFQPHERLHSGRDYGRVFRSQQKLGGRHFAVLIHRRRPGEPARLGVVVSTKVAKRSVRRHQLKRWVRESFRQRWKALLPGIDLVILFRSDPPMGHGELEEEIRVIIERLLAGRGAGRQGHGPRPAGPGAPTTA